MACPETKDETHLLSLPLFVTLAEFYPADQRVRSSMFNIREFKKLRRQLQRKRRIKIELCDQLRLLRLFLVDNVVQNRRTALSLAWYERFSCKGKE